MRAKHLSSVTDCARGGRKDALCICAHSGNSAQTDPKKCSFSSKVILWMVISYMAGTSAGAKVILQSIQFIPESPWGAAKGADGACGAVLEGRGLNGGEQTSSLLTALSLFAKRHKNTTLEHNLLWRLI